MVKNNVFLLCFLLMSLFGNSQINDSAEIDSDDDGIVDVLDKCPKLGGFVNVNGCPKPKPIAPISEEHVIRCFLKPTTAIYFKPKKSRLRNNYKRKLNEVCVSLMEKGNLKKKINIEGNTDGLESSLNNIQLSNKRASVVKKYLIKKGVSESRLFIVSNGNKYPIADNKTFEGRAQNRRVVINLRK